RHTRSKRDWSSDVCSSDLPIAKVSFDWLFGFKLRHWLDHQKGFIFYFEQLLFIFESIVFHVSIFLAPIGMLFLIIRHFVRRKRRSEDRRVGEEWWLRWSLD